MKLTCTKQQFDWSIDLALWLKVTKLLVHMLDFIGLIQTIIVIVIRVAVITCYSYGLSFAWWPTSILLNMPDSLLNSDLKLLLAI